ncbi:MAG: hypothetical protein FWF56_05175 [Firmicutes bacterium]|nr:hypothetical protein [Bacillota bacterium]MCL1953375.1 hypothetical protein [Bacillota bacterium]
MTISDAWNLLVDIHNKSLNMMSGSVQSNWESIFGRVLGYSAVNGDIFVNRMGSLNAADAVIDFSIKSKMQDAFFCYIKLGDTKTYIVNLKEKLYSTLRFFNMDLGLIVADKLYIYDYSGYVEQGFIEIDLVKDNWAGFRFIEMFFKDNFDKNIVKQFIQKYKNYRINVVDNSHQEAMKNKRKETVLNSINANLVHELLRAHFDTRISQDEWNEIISLFNIQITKKSTDNFFSNTSTNIVKEEVIEQTKPKQQAVLRDVVGALSRNDAITLCVKNGVRISKNIVYCSENKTSKFYCLDLPKELLNETFTLLLNDRTRKEINVLNVIDATLSKIKFATKDRNHNIVSLELSSRDGFFMDKFTKFSFDKYWSIAIKYDNS